MFHPIASQMLVVLYLLWSRSVNGLPTTAFPQTFDSTTEPWTFAAQYRTLWQIIYSCISTMVYCTWSSLHPNIPPHTDGKLARIGRRVRLTLSFLMIPEMIVLWATLQLRGARRLAKSTEFKERGWKTTHGFFAQMGGFVLHTAQGEPANVVWPRDLCAMLQSPLIENPRLTEEEIKARSKSDGIAKALAVIQTTYFFVQCIFRVKEGLPLTELEVITFTYTFVNVYLYVVWWNKPQNVDCAFPVYEKTVSNGGRIRTVPSISVAAECNRNFLSNLGLKLRKALNRLILLLKLAITAPFHGFSAWAVEQEDKGVTAMAVPDLYYFGQGHTSTEPLLAFTAIIGAIIGAIHLAVWNVALGYPTFQEKFAWRVSTVALTAIPPLLFIFVSLATFHRGSTPKLLVDISGTLCGPILMLLYIVCRLALLALPLAALRKLPPDMYRSTFADNLPHFS